MTNRLAILLGLTIVGLIAVDMLFYEAENLLFLGKKFLELMNWLAFWR